MPRATRRVYRDEPRCNEVPRATERASTCLLGRLELRQPDEIRDPDIDVRLTE